MSTFDDSEVRQHLLSVLSSRSRIDGATGCWLWNGHTRGRNRFKYGLVDVCGKRYGAHRLSYILHKGPIPEGGDFRGMCICHTCDNPLCVNPDHLFLGTHQENMTDKTVKGRTERSKTHCRHGHERNEENTYRYKGGSAQCRVCAMLRQRARVARLKAEQHIGGVAC